ncbi:MAG: HesA/MoeB/ThiF family protein [Acidobacteriia bacterium]|nr:HesA/MoeB/ThiF family protein [Terriglobia bacterium]
MLTVSELDHYSRQIPVLGEEGQERLRKASIFVAGAGGLSAAICGYLAAAGVGCIRIADPDSVDISNLNRQIFYRGCDVGKTKATVLQERLISLNPHIQVHALITKLDDANAEQLVGDASLLLDALDNFPSRHVLNRVALRLGIPLVHGAVREFYGQVTTIVPYQTPCLSCIWGDYPSAAATPILGATCGVIGSVQATEAVKVLTGKGENLFNRLFVWDGLRIEVDIFQLERNPACPDCGSRRHERDRENVR